MTHDPPGEAAAAWAEFLKIGTLPSNWLAAVATVAGSVIVAAALASNNAAAGDAETAISLLREVPGYSVVGFLVLGVLVSTSEYQGTQMHTSLLAVPRRGLLADSKLLAFVVSCAAVAVSSMAAAAVVLALPADSRGALALTAASCHLLAMGLVAVALGLLTRQVVGALASSIGLVMLAPPVLTPLTTAAEWLPSAASSQLFLTQGQGPLSEGAATALACWLLVFLVGARLRLVRGDA